MTNKKTEVCGFCLEVKIIYEARFLLDETEMIESKVHPWLKICCICVEKIKEFVVNNRNDMIVQLNTVNNINNNNSNIINEPCPFGPGEVIDETNIFF